VLANGKPCVILKYKYARKEVELIGIIFSQAKYPEVLTDSKPYSILALCFHSCILPQYRIVSSCCGNNCSHHLLKELRSTGSYSLIGEAFCRDYCSYATSVCQVLEW
jgi:hypothetical protein